MVLLSTLEIDERVKASLKAREEWERKEREEEAVRRAQEGGAISWYRDVEQALCSPELKFPMLVGKAERYNKERNLQILHNYRFALEAQIDGPDAWRYSVVMADRNGKLHTPLFDVDRSWVFYYIVRQTRCEYYSTPLAVLFCVMFIGACLVI
jgi:hypothetical protein